ncbi:MAG: DUF4160 domain-containing protein [Saprospiraceae bacterium]|nr:DUF4160 domain-containing protein [Saprospiraceae bacterium]
MFFNDHNPPHFKVKYNEYEANILIENGNLLNLIYLLTNINWYNHGQKYTKMN